MKKLFFFLCFYALLLLSFSVSPASAQSCTVENITAGNAPVVKINYGPAFANREDLCILIHEPTGPWESKGEVTLDNNGSFDFTGPKLNKPASYDVYTGFRNSWEDCYRLNNSPGNFTDICSSSFLVHLSPDSSDLPQLLPVAGAPTPTCSAGKDADGNDITGTPTALGCIPNEPAAAIKLILPWAIGLGTGLAFLLFLYGALTLITAGSDPQKVDTGKSIITSAAAGLIFIILSMLLLRVIGVNILGL